MFSRFRVLGGKAPKRFCGAAGHLEEERGHALGLIEPFPMYLSSDLILIAVQR